MFEKNLCKEKNSKRRRSERVLLQWVDKWKPSESTIYRPCIQSRCTSTLVASSQRSENVCLTSNASVGIVLVLRESPRSRYYFSTACKLKLTRWKNGPIKSRPVYDIPLHENPEFVRDTSFVTEFYSSRQKTNIGKVSFYSF